MPAWIVDSLRKHMGIALAAVVPRSLPVSWKRFGELLYWRRRKRLEGTLSNSDYKQFYTTHFGLGDDDYAGRAVLDIGCGPRGSLEWASMAARRIGLDPLADEYRRLGAGHHRMDYVASAAENMPLPDASCDIVCTFNSLDHVEDVDRTIAEIKRVTRPGGTLLLIVEVNHRPTLTEPHLLTPQRLLAALAPEFRCADLRVYRPEAGGAYGSIRTGGKVDDPLAWNELGWLSARFVREHATPEPDRRSAAGDAA